MDYNDKLKLAKEALESGSYDRETIEYIFPELKESDDEKIREEIIAYMRYERKSTEEEIENRFIPWLEKQCKQKTNEIHPIFRVGDYIRNKKTCDKVLIEQLDVKSKAYCYTSYDGGAEIHSDFPFSKQDEWELIGQKIVEQKSAWSEEDEKHYQGCLHVMNLVLNAKPYPYYNDYLWLKSIKERYTWKPSDEQMNFLWKYAEQNNYDGRVLTSLFRDLKKLREE